MKPSVVIDRGLSFLSSNSWTQHAYARDTKGNPVHPCDPTASRWCIVGSLVKGLDGEQVDARVFRKAIHAIEVYYKVDINTLNDRKYLFKEDILECLEHVSDYLKRKRM